jgi:hypothetical protein
MCIPCRVIFSKAIAARTLFGHVNYHLYSRNKINLASPYLVLLLAFAQLGKKKNRMKRPLVGNNGEAFPVGHFAIEKI